MAFRSVYTAVRSVYRRQFYVSTDRRSVSRPGVCVSSALRSIQKPSRGSLGLAVVSPRGRPAGEERAGWCTACKIEPPGGLAPLWTSTGDQDHLPPALLGRPRKQQLVLPALDDARRRQVVVEGAMGETVAAQGLLDQHSGWTTGRCFRWGEAGFLRPAIRPPLLSEWRYR